MRSKKILIFSLVALVLLFSLLLALYKPAPGAVTAKFIEFANSRTNEDLALVQLSNSYPQTIMLLACNSPDQISFSYVALRPLEQRQLTLTLSPNRTNATSAQLIFFRQPSRLESFTLLPWVYFRGNKTSVPPRLILKVPCQIPKK